MAARWIGSQGKAPDGGVAVGARSDYAPGSSSGTVFKIACPPITVYSIRSGVPAAKGGRVMPGGARRSGQLQAELAKSLPEDPECL